MKQILTAITDTLTWYDLKWVESLMDGDTERAAEIIEEKADYQRIADDAISSLLRLSKESKIKDNGSN